MKNPIVTLLVSLLMLLSNLALAGTFKTGMEAAKRGDFATAVKLWQPLAIKGHVEAQASMGHLYLLGKGVRQNDKEAAKWLEKAAQKGHTFSQFNLAAMFEEGRGVSTDVKKALTWYRKAAEQGDANAQNNLGRFYSEGAVLEENNVLALMLFSLAAGQGDELGQQNRAVIAQRLSAAQIEEGEALARSWKAGTPLPTRTRSPGKAQVAALPGAATTPPDIPRLPCSVGNALKNTYTPLELYMSVPPCIESGHLTEATHLFVLAGVYGMYDRLRVKDRSAHQAISVLKMAVTPSFTDAFRQHLSSMAQGPNLVTLCQTMKKVGPPDYYPSYMINHGLGAISTQLNGNTPDGSALDESIEPASALAEALDQYLHCP